MKFFLCHSSEDKEFVRKLAADLYIHGHRAWFDEWDIGWGDSIFEKIESGINESNYLIVVMSPNSVKSRWVKTELKAALSNELESNSTFVLPILYDKCEIPLFLKEKAYIDFRPGYDEGIKSVILAIKNIAGNPVYLKSVISQIVKSETVIGKWLVRELASFIEFMDISKDEFTDVFSVVMKTNAFLYPFIEYGKRYFSEQELMEMIYEKREFPYPEHAEFALYCAGFKDPELDEKYHDVGKSIAKYAGFSDEEIAPDIQKTLDKLKNDDVDEWIESVDVVKKDHKSKTIIEVLENLYHIGNGSSLKQIKEHAAYSYRILTSSIRLLFNTENIDSIFEFIQEISRSFTTNSQIAEIYKSITNICYEEEIHLKSFLQAFSMSENYTKYRVLSKIELFRKDVAPKLCRISQDCEAKDVARMANDYLAKV